MKVLVAGSGIDADDFAHTVPGEVVYLGPICAQDDPASDGSGSCGCGRSFTGLGSGAATTVAVVADLEVDLDELASLIGASLTASGWASDPEIDRDMAEEVAELAADHLEGTRFRRWIDQVRPE